MANSLTESRRRIILNSPHIASASGPIVTVNDAIKAKLKSCVIDINPVQEGTGDPSPDNIRPISGWEGCTVSRSGADTSDPTTFSISWQSEAGTVYGGTLDVTNGVLIVDRGYVDLGELNYTEYSTLTTKDIFYTSKSSLPYWPKVSQDEPFKGRCSNFTITYQNASSWPINSVVMTRSRGTLPADSLGIIVEKNSYQDAEAFKTAMVGVQLVYELNTPLTYQLTSTQIDTTTGLNNIWADTGDISVKYWAHS